MAASTGIEATDEGAHLDHLGVTSHNPGADETVFLGRVARQSRPTPENWVGRREIGPRPSRRSLHLVVRVDMVGRNRRAPRRSIGEPWLRAGRSGRIERRGRTMARLTLALLAVALVTVGCSRVRALANPIPIPSLTSTRVSRAGPHPTYTPEEAGYLRARMQQFESWQAAAKRVNERTIALAQDPGRAANRNWMDGFASDAGRFASEGRSMAARMTVPPSMRHLDALFVELGSESEQTGRDLQTGLRNGDQAELEHYAVDVQRLQRSANALTDELRGFSLASP
jgi:hypothetical protein